MGYEPTMLPLHYRAMLFGGPTRTWTRNKRLWVFRFYLWTIGPNLLRSLRDSNPSDWTPWQGDIHTKQTQRPIKMRERRDSNPQSQKRTMLQTARLPITGYSPILKKLIYEVQTVRTLSRQPAIRHLRCFTCLLCSHHIASHEISCSSLIDFSTNTFSKTS